MSDNKNIDYCLQLDYHWENTKKWWDNIILDNYRFSEKYKIVSFEEKEIFSIKIQYLIKKIFNIDDLNNFIQENNKINIKNYDFDKLFLKCYENKDLMHNIIEDDIEIKKIANYILQYQPYFKSIKKKILKIITIIFEEKYFNNLFKKDDDLTKILAPFAGTIFYLYLYSKDIEFTIQNTLLLDETYIIFFIVSYLIIDNFMDDINSNKDIIIKKKIFFKWFTNIVNNPSQNVELSPEEESIWQCVIFKKYYDMFYAKYPLDSNNENKIIYDFVKIMMKNLYTAHEIQKNKESSLDKILEASFKKSYVVSFFMALLINIQLKLNMNIENINNICKLLFLVQLYDDYFDIDKDLLVNNNTFFSSNNVNSSCHSWSKWRIG
jgi:hypothetical protein